MSEGLRYSVRTADGREYGPANRELIAQWAREGRVPADSLLMPEGGGPPISVLADALLASIVKAPPTVSAGVPPPGSYSGIIPYRNAPALIGYYCGFASLLPVVGLIAAPVAITLSIIGLRRAAANPAIKGQVHAWVGIVLGAVGFLISGTCVTGMIVGAIEG
jgi:hypothetical protein